MTFLSIRLCELHKIDVDTDTESEQVPFELCTLPLQQLQIMVTTMLACVKCVALLTLLILIDYWPC